MNETIVHNYAQSRSDEKQVIFKQYPKRDLDYLLFQTGTYDVLHYRQATAKQILDPIFAFIQLCWYKFTPRLITVCTVPLHGEDYEEKRNVKIRFRNNILRVACKQLNFRVCDLELYLENCQDTVYCRN